MAHLRADTLERYTLGRLSDASAGHAEEHLLLCGTCRQRLDEFDSFLALLRVASVPLTMSA